LSPSISARESAAMFKLRTSGSAGASHTATAGLCCFSRAGPWSRALRHSDSFRLSRDVTLASSGCGSVQIEHILEPQNLYLPSALLVGLEFSFKRDRDRMAAKFYVWRSTRTTRYLWLNSGSNTYITRHFCTLVESQRISLLGEFPQRRLLHVESKLHNGPRASNIRSHILS
jgi:hypothetical protein